ncbi:hypothetical protein J7E78_17800 [Paenibacillus polymyxa]|uniref:hypothetical protein n=1 Tax=Paenibacillus polymyxa TaxID=1406 RepID=UPI001BED31C8|nr:hypothetical protein [Paenibacillus polymyxa]MBT2285399.1 hypothetical protein [Paenibacillus polymyxa]
MIRKTFEFYIFFNKIILREGIGNYLWSLLMPILIFVSININWFYKTPPIHEIISSFSAIWSYNFVGIFLYGIASRISIFRENGFLRSFTYVAGDKKPIIFSLYWIQIIHGSIIVLAFTIISALIFRLPVIELVEISIVSFLIVSLPLAMLMLLLAALPVTTATLNSVASLVMLPALFMTMFRNYNYTQMNDLFLLSPVEYVSRICRMISDFFFYGQTKENFSLLLVITFVYLIIGIFSLKFLKINSKIVRT